MGSGDSFGSGGKLQPCIHLKTAAHEILLDCGSTVLCSMRRFHVDPNNIEVILLTHLHGDHFGGIPFYILDAQLVSKRTEPLIIAGPVGTEQRIREAMEVMFPGSSKIQQKFDIKVVEMEPDKELIFKDIKITPFLVEHYSGAPSLSLRLETQGKVITHTGDTAWTDSLLYAGQGADLVIAESYFYKKQIKFHMDYKTLMQHWNDFKAKRLVITHFSQEMLDMLGEVECEYAEDGKEFEV